mmetsp:Transcript_4033/g.13746  ORF Transcript_4033/g.13746 Transcript_4033/m.13746 type:complete len:153 (+) Transcript_4033:133-591(+)
MPFHLPAKQLYKVVGGIVAIVRELKRRLPTARLLCMALLPRGDYHGIHERNVLAINGMLREALAQEGSVEFYDLWRHFSTDEKHVKPELYVHDKLHLSPQGYQVWGTELATLLSLPSLLPPVTPHEHHKHVRPREDRRRRALRRGLGVAGER